MAKQSRLDKLLLKSSERYREERDSGIARKGRKSMFDEGKWVGGLIRDWGGLKNIPQYIRDTFKKPKSKQGKTDFNLGVEYGKK